MVCAPLYLVFSVLFLTVYCQEYDFAAEITRQCLVPDPVGLLDCVENKVTLPYLISWVDCTNSLGQNVKTSADVINYRCKSVWEGKGVIPEVFYIKDCVIEKTGLPAKNVSAEVLGAYKECESTPNLPPQSVKTAPIQQQLRSSSVQYRPLNQQIQAPVLQPPHQAIQVQAPILQIQAPRLPPFQQATQVQIPIQQNRGPVLQLPQPQLQLQKPVQQLQAPLSNPRQSFQMQIPFQPAQPALTQSLQQMQVSFQQSQVPVSFQTLTRPGQLNQQTISGAFSSQHSSKPSYSTSMNPSIRSQPYSQQFFTIYPQAQLANQQQNVNNRGFLSQKTIPNQQFLSQQLVSASTQGSPAVLNAPYSYSFQIHHSQQPF